MSAVTWKGAPRRRGSAEAEGWAAGRTYAGQVRRWRTTRGAYVLAALLADDGSWSAVVSHGQEVRGKRHLPDAARARDEARGLMLDWMTEHRP